MINNAKGWPTKKSIAKTKKNSKGENLDDGIGGGIFVPSKNLKDKW